MSLPAPDEWPTDPSIDAGSDLLALRAASTPDRTAVVDADSGDAWTYREFDRRVDRTAAALAGVGGRRVAFLLETRPAFAAAYFAVARRGGTVVPLNRRLAVETLATQTERADVDLVVCEAETDETARTVAPPDAPVVSVDALDATDGAGPLEPRDGTAGDADRLVLFTSGTTGEPKGVRLTRANLVASAVGSARRLGVDTDDRWLVCLPMYHMGGLAPLVRSTLYGTTTVIQREFDADRTAAVIDDCDVTGVSLVPTMLTRLLDAGWRPPGSLRFALVGGAPAARDLVERSLDRGVPVCPTYGLTETASQVATATPAEVREHPDTVGRPLSGTTVRVLDGDGEPCDPGETGELVVDGPTVTPGYLDGERGAFGERGFHTGDLGRVDGDGRLWVVGRVDDAVVTGGENVHPARVADALRDCEGVADAAVVGLPDEEWGERVAALVVPDGSAATGAGGGALAAGTVRDRARERLADFAVPKTVGFAESLPRTASGTVDREAVRERLRSEDRER